MESHPPDFPTPVGESKEREFKSNLNKIRVKGTWGGVLCLDVKAKFSLKDYFLTSHPDEKFSLIPYALQASHASPASTDTWGKV